MPAYHLLYDEMRARAESLAVALFGDDPSNIDRNELQRKVLGLFERAKDVGDWQPVYAFIEPFAHPKPDEYAALLNALKALEAQTIENRLRWNAFAVNSPRR